VARGAHMSYQNKFPILARQVLVSGLDDGIVEDVGLGAEHGVCVSPVGDGMEDRQGRNCGLGVTQEGRGGQRAPRGTVVRVGFGRCERCERCGGLEAWSSPRCCGCLT
jgi:hypothetical protein